LSLSLSVIWKSLVEPCCKGCSLSVSVVVNVRFTTNGMCVKNNTRVARISRNKMSTTWDHYCCLVPQCEALRSCCSQGRINHWANRANARGLAHLGPRAWISKHAFTDLSFSIFRLFTTRQNCRAFWLLRLVYRSGKLTTFALIVFEWLKIIEPNSTTLYDPRFRSKSVYPMGVRRNFSRVEATSKFCLFFTGCWRCNANGCSQNALPFLPH